MLVVIQFHFVQKAGDRGAADVAEIGKSATFKLAWTSNAFIGDQPPNMAVETRIASWTIGFRQQVR